MSALPPHIPPLPPPPGAEPQPEPPSPPGAGPGATVERSSALPIVLALVVTVAVGAGAVALVSWARGGDSCPPGAFASIRFGYCVEAPAGWLAAAAESPDVSLDRFLVQDGAGTITVTAVPLDRGQDLARFEQFVRAYAEEAGARTGTATPLEVDGADGVAFDVALEGPDGTVRSREVLVVNDGIAWRITLADETSAFEASARQLDEMLDSWRFT